jgi:hypothetical protein
VFVNREYSTRQFKTFRILLGAWLAYHFISLVPYSNEMFSNENVLFVICAAALAAVLLAANFARKFMALYLYGTLVFLIYSNKFYYDIDLDYLGWLLLASVFVSETKEGKYEIPTILFWGAWAVLGLSYTLSGVSKFSDQNWQDGRAISLVMNQAVSRVYTEFYKTEVMQVVFRLSTWFVLLAETLFLPMICYNKTRRIAFWSMTMVQIGIAFMTIVSELNVAALLFHLFVLENRKTLIDRKTR